MKKIIYLFLSTAFAVATLTACSSSSSDNDGNNPSLIVGSWESYKLSLYKDGNLIGEELYENNCDTNKDYVVFNANGTMKNYDYNYDCTLTTSDGEYSIDGNTITVIDEDNEGTDGPYQIITLNSTTFVVEIPNSDIEDENGEIDTSLKMRMEFKRK